MERGDNMMEPKFLEYITFEKERTKHGYEYCVLEEDTPEDIKKDYQEYLDMQDNLMKNGELVFK